MFLGAFSRLYVTPSEPGRRYGRQNRSKTDLNSAIFLAGSPPAKVADSLYSALMSVSLILVLAAFALVVVSAIGRAPLWPAVLFLIVDRLLALLPVGRP